MFRQFVIIAAVSSAYVSGFKYEDIPQEYREIMPEPLKNFLTGVTPEDQAVMRDIYTNFHTYKSDEEVMAAIKQKSPSLAAKLGAFRGWMEGKVAALGPEAKGFAQEMDQSGRKIRAQYFTGKPPTHAELKQSALDTIKKYNAMSDAGKADFQKHFPIMAKVFTSEQVLKHLQSMN